jgi:transposase
MAGMAVTVTTAGAVSAVEGWRQTDRRRRWPPALKAQLVAESYRIGAKVSEVAARHGVTMGQLYEWRRRQPAAEETPPSFAPVIVDGAAPGGCDGQSIVVEMAGAVVRVPVGASPPVIAAVLGALRAQP